MELAIRLGTEKVWVPIVFSFLSSSTNDKNEDLNVGERSGSSLEIRGYEVDQESFSVGNRSRYSVQVCGFEEALDSIQFRWLQTDKFNDRNIVKDIWSIDDVMVSYEPEEGVRIILLEDFFDEDQLK